VPFDQQKADLACNFFEKVLKHTQDQYVGKPFLLLPWQEEVISAIFGQVDENGARLIEQAYLEVPKKSGKTELIAGVVLLVLMLDPNSGNQVYGAASGIRQALNVYKAASSMVDQSPLLKSRLRLLPGTNRIVKKRDPYSFYAAIAADGDTGDGVNPSFTCADELHRWRTRKQMENWDVLSNGGITRKQTLTIAITTAGVRNESPLCWKLHEKTLRIKQGIITDPKFFGKIYAADAEDDPADPKTWIKANPSLEPNGGFLPIKKYQEKYDSHVAEGDLTSFKRYFLNIWDLKENRAIDLNQWDACNSEWKAQGLAEMAPEDKVRPLPADLLRYFVERRCWAGIDMSFSIDMSAVVFVFDGHATFNSKGERLIIEDGGFDVLPFFWMPAKNVRKRELKDAMPYQRWGREGLLELCDGEIIDHRDVQARLEWGARMFEVEKFCFDKYNSREISIPMTETGYPCVEIPQGFNRSDPNKKLLELIAQGKFRHGGHPILRFNASCLSTKERDGLVRFIKPERLASSSRIDGLDAASDAMFYGMIAETPSSYPFAIL
jgi:phage terminase large subunit-like protein